MKFLIRSFHVGWPKKVEKSSFFSKGSDDSKEPIVFYLTGGPERHVTVQPLDSANFFENQLWILDPLTKLVRQTTVDEDITP